MRDTYETCGFFTPQDLKEMQDELDTGAVPGETALDREIRAVGVFNRKIKSCPITPGKALPPRDGRALRPLGNEAADA